MKGKKPLPTSVRLLRGGRLKRPINQLEPQHPPIEPDVPAELTDPNAAAEWRRVIDTLSRGHVTQADRPTLIGYCLKYGQWRGLEAAAARDGFMTFSANGHPIVNPLIGAANKVFLLLLKAAAELGLTPTSRTRVQQQPHKEPTGTPVDAFTAWQRKRRSGAK